MLAYLNADAARRLVKEPVPIPLWDALATIQKAAVDGELGCWLWHQPHGTLAELRRRGFRIHTEENYLHRVTWGEES